MPATPSTTHPAHRALATCQHCRRVAELDLPALIAQGHGDTPLLELPLRCRGCGKRGHWITVGGWWWAKGVAEEGGRGG